MYLMPATQLNVMFSYLIPRNIMNSMKHFLNSFIRQITHVIPHVARKDVPTVSVD